MKRFLFVMFEGGGNVPVQVAIAKRLVGRGHRVRVLADAATERALVGSGCEFSPYRTAPHHDFRDRERDLVRDWAVTSPIKQFQRVARELMFGPAQAFALDVLGELEGFAADALAVDSLLFGAMIGAEASGLPVAQLHHTPYSWPTVGVPPFGTGFAPARGVLGRARDGIVRRLLTAMFEREGRAPVNAARATVGLPPLASVFHQAQRQQRTLVLTTKAYDFAGRVELPSHVVYVGPQLEDPSWASPWQSPWPADAGEPLVVVALGSTFQNQLGATQRVVDALGSLPVRGLVTLGGVFAPEALTLPPNVFAVDSAPHGEVIPRASVVVAHGGHGTVMKALAHGKPLLCLPLGRDQGDNAARVAFAGAGLRLAPSAGIKALERAIAQLLTEPEFARGAQRLAADIAQDVAEDRAVRELEQLAATGVSDRAAPQHAADDPVADDPVADDPVADDPVDGALRAAQHH